MNLGKWVSTSLVFSAAAGLVACVGFLVDSLLVKHGMPGIQVLLLSNAALGVVAGVIFVQYRKREWEKQQIQQERLNKIAAMNHHVRNALAVVAFYGTQVEDICAAQRVSDAVERIEWTLREVLPKGWNLEGPSAEELSEMAPAPGLSCSSLERAGYASLSSRNREETINAE